MGILKWLNKRAQRSHKQPPKIKYQYVVAFKVLGIQEPSQELEGATFDLPAQNMRARLTGNLETLPPQVDTLIAIGHLLLRGITGQGGQGTFEERLSHEISNIKAQRIKEFGDGAFLVFEAQGEIDDFNPQPQRETPDLVFAIDSSPKQEIRDQYRSAIHALLSAFAVAIDHVCGVKQVVDAVTFIRADGKPLYCVMLTGSGSAYVVSQLPADVLPFIKRSATILTRHQPLVDAARLLSRSLAEDNDPLLSFLSVWSGLEIFVNKNFKYYENIMLGRVTDSESNVLPPKVIERIRNVMSDKYRLSDKFSVIASELADDKAESDQATFDELKKVRDKLLHGEDISLADLPINKTRKLLRKYLWLHLERDRT